MTWRDLAAMAVGNLRKSPWRTILNAGSVFVGCLLLFLVLAGTRGISESIRQFVEQNQLLRKVIFFPDYDPELVVPEEEVQVLGEMSDQRRERIRERLKNEWRRSHVSSKPVDLAFIDELSKWPHVSEVVPDVYVSCEIVLDNELIESSLAGVSVNDQELRGRIEFGQPLLSGDESGILLHEFTAYQLGWRDDDRLPQLIGRTVTIKHQVSSRQLSGMLDYLQHGNQESSLQERVSLLATMRQLFDEMDATQLTGEQKTLLRDALQFDLENSEQENQLLAIHTFVIRGIFRDADQSLPWSWLRNAFGGGCPGLYVTATTGVDMFLQDPQATGFDGGSVEVDSYRHVAETEQSLEEHGMYSISAAWFVDSIDGQIAIARRIAGGAAFVIFFIAALGMSNAMTIAVLQRTREFGIMKSLGARDSCIVMMMLLEGFLIGLIGAVSALVTALVASQLLNQIVKDRLQDSWSLENSLAIFDFSIGDVTMVFAIALGTTVLSCVFPARRAARLDAVRAMQL